MKGKRGRKKVRRQSNKDESDEDDDPQLYCICRSSKCDTFMIACDACEDWFHGDCINVSPKQAECIQTFFCPDCREKDSTLKIEFKNDNSNGKPSYGGRQRTAISSPAVVESDEFMDVLSTNLKKRGRKHPQNIQSRSRRNINSLSARRDESSEDELEVTSLQFASPSSGYSQSNSVTGSYSHRSKYGRMTPPVAYDNVSIPEVQPRWRHLSSRGLHAQPCGECEGCKRTEDCGNCNVCRSPKFKQGRSRQRCVYKTCVGLEPPPSRRGRIRTSSKISPNQSQLSDFDYESNFDDYSSSRKFVSGPSKSGSGIGSKMRRGDHLPGVLSSNRHIHERGMEPQFSRRSNFPDVGLIDEPDFTGSYGISPSHRNDRNGSRYGSSHLHPSEIEPSLMRSANDILGHGDSLGPGDPPPTYESEDDVMLPDMQPCSGPACVKPAVRSRYCSEECQLRHESNTIQRPHPASRFASTKEQILTPYALSYPDHLYCKHHHRSHAYNAESTMSMQQSGSSISDIYSDIYPPFSGQFVNSNQSANMDYVYDQMTQNQTPALSSYRRLSNHSNTTGSVGDDFPLNYNPYSQSNQTSKNSIQLSHSRKFTGIDDLRVDRSRPHLTGSSDHLSDSIINSTNRGNGRIICIANRHQQQPIGNNDGLPPDLSLDAITPTMQSIRMYNGGHGGSNYRVSSVNTDISQGGTRTELLSADANDLIDVDGNSSSGIGPTSNNTPAFRQGDEYYTMNENENIEINWPTSPNGVATASAGTA